MGFIDSCISKLNNRREKLVKELDNYRQQDEHGEDKYPTVYCMRCYADLELQKGFSKDLSYWICKGCGEMCINPEISGDIVWVCDGCGDILNLQKDFNEEVREWSCTKCSYVNQIDLREIFRSEEEFISFSQNPYKGLTDEEMLVLSCYEEIGNPDNKPNVFYVRDMEDGKKYVKKILTVYDKSVYEYLLENPVQFIPQIQHVFEGDNSLVIIEEYIEGDNLFDVINNEKISYEKVIFIAKRICTILAELHSLANPIIHRDIKPSNVILGDDGEVYLLDVNAAKWYKEGEKEDTVLVGTQYFAAPEQFGYGFYASSEKSDIYALGMLINVMLTGKMPKEEKATGLIWSVIEKCIRLNPEERYTDSELLKELENLSFQSK